MWVWYKNTMERLHPYECPFSILQKSGCRYITTYTSQEQTIPVVVIPFPVTNCFPEKEQAAWAVQRLCLKYSWGPSDMKADHL